MHGLLIYHSIFVSKFPTYSRLLSPPNSVNISFLQTPTVMKDLHNNTTTWSTSELHRSHHFLGTQLPEVGESKLPL